MTHPLGSGLGCGQDAIRDALPGYELIGHVQSWQAWGKATWGKLNGTEPALELEGSVPVGGVDEGVCLGKGSSHLSGCGVEARSRGATASSRTLPGILPENSAGTERLGARRLVGFSRLLFDLSKDLDHRRPVLSRAEMRPTGQGLEYDPLGYGKVAISGRLSLSPGIELPGPVVPEASQLCSLDKGSSAVDSRPLERAPDKPFLAGLGEDIA